MENEVTYELKSPFEYASKGDNKKAEFISLKAPTMKQHTQAAAFTQLIMRMATSAAKGAKDDLTEPDDGKDSGMTAEVILAAIYTSEAVSANAVFESAKALFKEGVALVEGEEKLTAGLIAKMSIKDFESLVGEFVVNFTLA